MTEWWVSQPKHFCKICRVWTGGHRSQILKHEGGQAHIENEAKGIKDARERDKKRKAEEQDLKEQLAEIERKALAAMCANAAPPPATPVAAVTGGLTVAADAAAAQAAQKQAIVETVEAAKRRRNEGASASPWTAHVDPNSKCTYYYNSVTKESSWVKPPDFIEPAPTPAQASQAATGASTAAAAPMAATVVVQQTLTQQQLAARQSSVQASTVQPAVQQVSIEQQPISQPAASAAGGSPWVVCTDPNSGHIYYFNKFTQLSTWERPADLGVDLSKPPPPPSLKPPGPPKRSGNVRVVDETAGLAGGWEEVRPEDSMWKPDAPRDAAGGGSRASAGPDSDDETPDPIIQMKYLAMSRGDWMDEDFERHEKTMVEKTSTTGPLGAKVSFSMTRQKASGIRKREVED